MIYVNFPHGGGPQLVIKSPLTNYFGSVNDFRFHLDVYSMHKDNVSRAKEGKHISIQGQDEETTERIRGIITSESTKNANHHLIQAANNTFSEN